MDERMTLVEFIALANLTMKVERVPENPNMEGDKWAAFHWFVTFNTAKRHAAFYFSTGIGHAVYQERFPLHIGGLKPIYKGATANNLPMISGRILSEKSRAEIVLQYFTPTKPDAASVLSCLMSDAQSVDGRDFEDWAGDLGYDADSIKAKHIYKLCKRDARKLRSLIGVDLFNTLLTNVEPL